MSRTELSQDGAVLVAALTSPGRGLAAVAERRRLLLALLTATAASLAFAAVAAPRLAFPAPPGEADMTPHAIEVAAAQAQKVGAIATWAGAIAGPATSVLLCGLALFLAFKLAGTRPTLRGAAAVAAHAMLPLFLSQLLLIPALLLKAPVDAADLPRLLPSSLAALLPAAASPIATAVATSFDVFTVWTVLLLIFGMARVAGATRRRAAVVVLVLWAMQIALLKVAATAATAAAAAHGAPGGA